MFADLDTHRAVARVAKESGMLYNASLEIQPSVLLGKRARNSRSGF